MTSEQSKPDLFGLFDKPEAEAKKLLLSSGMSTGIQQSFYFTPNELVIVQDVIHAMGDYFEIKLPWSEIIR